ncbi:MAG: hypothetical protein JW955_23635 [Sedimentisphaerales bacterium]|nr:hypothetical protein [Sedimentisphaerales bacterium]
MAAKAQDILNDLIGRVARVRLWLVALVMLKTAAAGLASVCFYLGLYAWLDHRAHFGHAGRLSALFVLILLLAVLSYFLVRALRHSMTYACAANYVENRRSFDQQLVAAVEYFERGQDYPYSRVLAEQLVIQVDKAARGFRFDSTINKWQGYVLAGFILLGLSLVGLFVHQNILYVSSYLSRLFRPLAQIEPVSATVLKSVTEDIVVARDAPVTFAAAIEGRTPESAAILLTPHSSGDANDANVPPERIEIRPSVDAHGNAILTATKSFDTLGRFSYQFEADAVSSDAHTVKVCEPPSIKGVTARVSLPPSRHGESASTYTQQIEAGTLEVLPHSVVELHVECTTPLREASVATPGGREVVPTPAGTDAFNLQLPVDAASSLEFKLTSTEGIENREPQQLRIVLKGDEPPQFKLLSPGGDCLATDVASIPITFEVTDDFGLDAAQLYFELPGRGPMLIHWKVADGAKSATLTRTLELEQYDLQVGDSLLFYARATDIDTGQGASDANHCSEVYFIEIRPYRQYWHPQPGGQSSSQPGPVPEDLITILEYTRALLKKTWAMGNEPRPAGDSASRFDALHSDAEYCARQLADIRDDPDNAFDEADKASLRKIGERYDDARDKLSRRDAGAALPPVRDAYRLLRQFVDELHLKWKPPQSGQSVPEDKPERVKLQEEPQDSQANKERIENQLEQLQRKIESLARRQKSLSCDVGKAIQQEQATPGGQSGHASSSRSSSEQSSPGTTQSPPQGSARDSSGSEPAQAKEGGAPTDRQGPSPGSAEISQSSQVGDTRTTQAQSLPGDPSGGAQKGQAREEQSGGSQGEGQSSAGMDARWRMLEARQKAAREQALQVYAELQRLPAMEMTTQGRARTEAQKHVAQAIEQMEESQDQLTDARYQSGSAQSEAGLSGLAEAAGRELSEAAQAIREGLSGKQPNAAEQARELAEQLAQDADALDESLSPTDRQRMLERLEAAKRLLQSRADPQWSTVSDSAGSGGGLVYTRGAPTTPAETARMLAREFWSMAIEARQKELQPFAEPPSDAEFFQAEKEFFEKAARFQPPGSER